MRVPDLEHAIPQILHGWRGQLRAGGNQSARQGARGAAERGLVAALLRAALAPEGDEAPMRGLVVSAVTYGSTERIRRLDPGEVCEELGLLRNEVWKRLRDAEGGGGGSGDAAALPRLIGRLDQAVSVASAAVLRGGYACELRKLGLPVEPDVDPRSR